MRALRRLNAASFSPSGRRGTGVRGVFPFRHGGQAFAFRFSVSFGGEPRNERDRRVQRRVRARVEIARPVLQIRIVGEQMFYLRSSAIADGRGRIRRNSPVGHGSTSSAKALHRNFLWIVGGAEERPIHTGRNPTMPAGSGSAARAAIVHAEIAASRMNWAFFSMVRISRLFKCALARRRRDLRANFFHFINADWRRPCCRSCCGRRSIRWRFVRR